MVIILIIISIIISIITLATKSRMKVENFTLIEHLDENNDEIKKLTNTVKTILAKQNSIKKIKLQITKYRILYQI